MKKKKPATYKWNSRQLKKFLKKQTGGPDECYLSDFQMGIWNDPDAPVEVTLTFTKKPVEPLVHSIKIGDKDWKIEFSLPALRYPNVPKGLRNVTIDHITK